MDKDCLIISFERHHLRFRSGPISSPPEVRTEDIMIHEFGGDLHKGVYHYAVTAVGVNGESTAYNPFMVNAKYPENIVYIKWNPIPYLNEYRVYRGTVPGVYDGYFTVFTSEGEFYDDGRGVLNQLSFHPPLVDKYAYEGERIIHRSCVKHISSLYSGDDGFVYITLTSGETIEVNIKKVINKTWYRHKPSGLIRAEVEFKDWLSWL